MPEGVYHRALKAEVEVVDGSVNNLLWDLALYRHVLQRVVDALWDLGKTPRKSQLHQLFYPMLRNYGFRAHVARNIYNMGLSLVESARRNNGSKPVVKKLSSRLDYQDAKVDLGNGLVRVILRGKWFTLRIKHRKDYVDRFSGLKWKEIQLKYYNGKLYVSIVFEVRYEPFAPKGVVAIDTNLKQIVAFNGSSVRRYETRFVEALSERARAEEIQKKYPKRWRYNQRILNRVRFLYRKARNIVIDWSWKFAKEIVLRAGKMGLAIALEDLTYLRESASENGGGTAWKLSMFAYRRLQHSIVSKAVEYNVPIIFVDPKNTSSTCPKCGAKLLYSHRLANCTICEFKADRDTVGAMNIWYRSIQAYVGVPGSLPNTLPVKDEARRREGTKDEGMKKSN